MSYKHSHDCQGCQHECVHYCKYCGRVFCCKCGKEWGDGWIYSQPYVYSPNTCGTFTADNTGGVTTDTVKCCHSH